MEIYAIVLGIVMLIVLAATAVIERAPAARGAARRARRSSGATCRARIGTGKGIGETGIAF